jgi:phosphopantetheine--protein transferase-like protein
VIGIDLVNIDEFRRQLELTGEALVHRAFSEEEVSLCNAENSSPTVDQLATLWAAKEAVIKAALSPPASLKDVVISPDGSGRLSGRIGKAPTWWPWRWRWSREFAATHLARGRGDL